MAFCFPETLTRRDLRPVTGSTGIILNRGQGADEWRGTLGEFLAENTGDDVDGLDAEEAADLADALARSETYTGGGGAAATYTVERDEEAA